MTVMRRWSRRVVSAGRDAISARARWQPPARVARGVDSTRRLPRPRSGPGHEWGADGKMRAKLLALGFPQTTRRGGFPATHRRRPRAAAPRPRAGRTVPLVGRTDQPQPGGRRGPGRLCHSGVRRRWRPAASRRSHGSWRLAKAEPAFARRIDASGRDFRGVGSGVVANGAADGWWRLAPSEGRGSCSIVASASRCRRCGSSSLFMVYMASPLAARSALRRRERLPVRLYRAEETMSSELAALRASRPVASGVRFGAQLYVSSEY